jgi:hypothetical protein
VEENSANVSKALCLANRERIYKHLNTATHGIVFLGTPHQGSNHAETAIAVTRVVKYAYPWIKTHLLETLQQNSTILQDLADDFRHLHSGFEIVSCFERVPTKLGLVSFPWSELFKDENNPECRSLTKTLH